MHILDVYFERLPPTEPVAANLALVLPDVQMHELDVHVQIPVRHELIPANLARVIFQLQVNAVDVFLGREWIFRQRILLWNWSEIEQSRFLDASTHLYKRVCSSFGPSGTRF